MTRPMTRRGRSLAVLLSAALLSAGAAAWFVTRPSSPPASVDAGLPTPTPVIETGTHGVLPWNKPLSLTAQDGTLQAVTVTDPDGLTLAGTIHDGRWVSDTTLYPDAGYHVAAVVKDRSGKHRSLELTARTTKATKTLHATLSPRDDRVVGIGLPAIVTLSRPVTTLADRAAVEARLNVTTDPPTTGAWRWMSSTELHYRGPSYWTKGTVIDVEADLDHLHLSDGVWGEGRRSTHYSVGSAIIATVDVGTHLMTVVVDGKLVRTVKVSTGRDQYPTKGGVHIVLEKNKLEVMDSQTVGIPRNSPAGYYEKVPNSVRISYGGAFVHAASWSVRDQGVRNVSHGCVNISPADAAWFFNLVKRGDIVNIVHAKAPPLKSDPGMSDWNIPFSAWPN